MPLNDAHTEKIRRGFTLTEMAIVLAVFGLVLGSIWAAASKVYENRRIANFTRQLTALTAAASAAYPRGHFSSAPSTFLMTYLLNVGAYPADLYVSSCPGSPWNNWEMTGCLISPFGTQVFLDYQDNFGVGAPASTNVYEIQIFPMAASDCNVFLPPFIAQAAGSGSGQLVWVKAGNAYTGPVDQNFDVTRVAGCSGNVVLQFML